MKGIDSIIRLHEWQLDEKRRKVADLERLAQRLHSQMSDLETEIRVEQKIASEDPLLGGAYGNYACAVMRRREKLLKSLGRIEFEMTRAQEEVAAAFQEFKKFDLIRNRNRERAAAEAKRVQQIELDEAGLGVFRRHQTT